MKNRRQIIGTAALGALALHAGTPAFAQARSRLARVFVGFPPGGGTDVAARVLAERVKGAFPDGIVVENRAGASGRLAVEVVKSSAPDGLTMLFVPDFILTIYPHSFRNPGYDPLADFVPVALVASTGYALTAGPALPAGVTNIRQLVEWLKANPKQAAFASTVAGSPSHFLNVMFSRAAGVEILNVSYKGGAPALQDLMGGQIPMGINPIGEVLAQLGTGKLRVLATTGAQRSRFLPDVPTLAESGFKDMVVESWLGLLVPARTPAGVVESTAAAINAAVQTRELKDAYAKFGMDSVQSTPGGFASTIRSDLTRWGPVIKASGFTAEE